MIPASPAAMACNPAPLLTGTSMIGTCPRAGANASVAVPGLRSQQMTASSPTFIAALAMSMA